MKMLATALALGLLAGCATSYEAGAMSGYEHSRLAPNVFQVTFRGNGFTTPEAARDLALLRSAELTLAYGYRYFVIVDGRSAVSRQSLATPGTSSTTTNAYAYGNQVNAYSTTTYNPGQTITVVKATTNNTIVASKERPDVGGLVYDAQFLWEELGAKYKVGRAPAP